MWLKRLMQALGGHVEEVEPGAVLPDGSGFSVEDLPRPVDHWLTDPSPNDPPMPLRLGYAHRLSLVFKRPAIDVDGEKVPHLSPMSAHPMVLDRKQLADKLREAARYAIRSATHNGQDMNFDPDALVQQLEVGLLGYHTPTGFPSGPPIRSEAP